MWMKDLAPPLQKKRFFPTNFPTKNSEKFVGKKISNEKKFVGNSSSENFPTKNFNFVGNLVGTFVGKLVGKFVEIFVGKFVAKYSLEKWLKNSLVKFCSEIR